MRIRTHHVSRRLNISTRAKLERSCLLLINDLIPLMRVFGVLINDVRVPLTIIPLANAKIKF